MCAVAVRPTGASAPPAPQPVLRAFSPARRRRRFSRSPEFALKQLPKDASSPPPAAPAPPTPAAAPVAPAGRGVAREEFPAAGDGASGGAPAGPGSRRVQGEAELERAVSPGTAAQSRPDAPLPAADAAAAAAQHPGYEAVRTTLRLSGMGLDQFDATARRAFVETMEEHLAKAGGAPDLQVAVVTARAGSVIIDTEIAPSPGCAVGACLSAVLRAVVDEGSGAAFAAALGARLGIPLTLEVLVAPRVTASRIGTRLQGRRVQEAKQPSERPTEAAARSNPAASSAARHAQPGGGFGRGGSRGGSPPPQGQARPQTPVERQRWRQQEQQQREQQAEREWQQQRQHRWQQQRE